jgi:hypothetical protein
MLLSHGKQTKISIVGRRLKALGTAAQYLLSKLTALLQTVNSQGPRSSGMLHSVMLVHTMCNNQEEIRHHLYRGRSLQYSKVKI